LKDRTPDPLATRLAVTELYASIQGESTHAGRPCTFIRLARCPLRCRWCDTVYSFDPGEPTTVGAVLDEVKRCGLPLVEVTGGEPLAQRGCHILLERLCDAGYEVLIETSGAFAFRDIDPRVKVIADLKCPGSDESHRNLLADLAALRSCDELKIVVADRADFDWALQRLNDELIGLEATVLWSAVHEECSGADLADWILQTKAPGRLQVQVHKVLWPAAERGV